MHQYILKLPTKFRLCIKIGSTSGNKEDVLHICFNTSKNNTFFILLVNVCLTDFGTQMQRVVLNKTAYFLGAEERLIGKCCVF